MTSLLIYGLLLVVSFEQKGNIFCFNPKGVMGKEKEMKRTSTMAVCTELCLAKEKCKFVTHNESVTVCRCHSNTTVVPPSLVFNTNNHLVSFDNTDISRNLRDVCGKRYCPAVPSVENGHFINVPKQSSVGSALSVRCNPGFMSLGKAACQDNGTWTSPVCVSVSSCSMVKHYQPDSEDGGYWLRLTNFNNYIARIYCHGMSTSSPQEFLTLSNTNYGIFPKRMTIQRHCGYETVLQRNCAGRGGEIQFRKIRVNIIDMRVLTEDRTFAKLTSNTDPMLKYGLAIDCYDAHGDNKIGCGTRGRFIIDLRRTGWRVRENQKWITFGWQPLIESIVRQMDGTLIRISCGGYPGGCTPKNGLFLTPYPDGIGNIPKRRKRQT